ncbi:GIY-YIG nuclease family protein [Syntrophomonas erecta]
MSWVYIVECADGTYYTGYTENVENRLAVHNAGKASRYTRGRVPVKLVYMEQTATKSQALRREAEIKKMKRQQKQKLIDGQS